VIHNEDDKEVNNGDQVAVLELMVVSVEHRFLFSGRGVRASTRARKEEKHSPATGGDNPGSRLATSSQSDNSNIGIVSWTTFPKPRTSVVMDTLDLLSRVERRKASATDLIEWATEALVRGQDSPSLRLLAGLGRVEHDEAESLFRASIAELGIEVPDLRELHLRTMRRRGIKESGDERTVSVGGVVFEGRIEESECNRCGLFVIYYVKYDAYFCPFCREWLDRQCSDPECEYCRPRPSVPPSVGGSSESGRSA
jgi:hypothetical protein